VKKVPLNWTEVLVAFDDFVAATYRITAMNPMPEISVDHPRMAEFRKEGAHLGGGYRSCVSRGYCLPVIPLSAFKLV